MDYFKGKKVLVTGHTGFKGAWLTLWLLEAGAEVTGYSIDVPTTPSLFEQLNLSSKMTDIRGDISDAKALQKTLDASQPEVVFHLAAQALVRESYENPLETFQTNAMGSAHLLELLRKNSSVKVAIFVTTDKVYENLEWEFGYRETDRLGGKDPYAASKAAAEIVFNSYFHSFFEKSSEACKLSTVRAGNVIGGGDWAKDRIVPDSIKSWMKSESVVLRNPNSIRPWQHVLEPLSGYMMLAAQLGTQPDSSNGLAFNFGPESQSNQTVLELVKEMQKVWKQNAFEVSNVSEKQKLESRFLMLSSDRAKSRLGWSPRLSFAESVEWTADWYYRVIQKKENPYEVTRNQLMNYVEKVQRP